MNDWPLIQNSFCRNYQPQLPPCGLKLFPYRDLLPKLPNTPLHPPTLYNKHHFLIQIYTKIWLFTQHSIMHKFSLLASGSSPSESPVQQIPAFVHVYSMCLSFLHYLIATVRSSPRLCRSQNLWYITHDFFINSCSMANTALSSWPFVLSRILSSLHQQQGISFWNTMSEFTSITL